VYLKSITLKGFKSFPDRTRLEFGPGTSVIVGPNGSGKSNITDAVLWALGEQSPAAVRGQSMQDVIFGGARGRRGAAAAEVEVVLDDAEGRLGLSTAEVSILRRLERSGEGEYRLAGARCRLVDVLELLSDTGIGREMHSVISQGRVESIVTSRPRDRRLLIEEAAGLGKHRKRRRRAELKLQRARQNLDRALDVEREARSRLRPLKRQAEAAEHHQRLARQCLEVSWELERDRLRSSQEALAQAESDLARARAARDQLEERLRAVAARREAAEDALAARSAHREELSRRCFAARSALERIGYRAETVAGALRSVQRRSSRAREQLEQLALQREPAAHDPRARERIQAAERELEALERDHRAELARQLRALEAERRSLAQRLSASAQVVAAAAGARTEAAERLQAQRERLRECQRAVEAARHEAARVGAELAAVNQFLRGQRPALDGSSALADELEVAPGVELALAAALDGRLGAMLVDDLPQGQAALEKLAGEGARALIAPAAGPAAGPRDADGGAGTRARATAHAATPPAPGATPLLDHVHGSARAVTVASALLADVWLVDSLDELTVGFGGVAVTRGGRVFNAPAGELRQAPAVGEERVLAERNRQARLIAETEAAVGAEHAARARLAEALARLAELEQEHDRLTDAHRNAVRERDELLEQDRRQAAAIKRRRQAPDEGPAAARRAQLTAELAAARAAAERLARERADRERAVTRLQASIRHDGELTRRLALAVDAIEHAAQAVAGQLERFDAELAADRRQGEELAGALRACAREEAELQRHLHDAVEALTEREVAASRARDLLQAAAQTVQGLADQLGLQAGPAEQALAPSQREALRERLERLQRRRAQLGPVNPLAAEEYEQALAHVEELEAQRGDLESALRELGKLIADTDREISECFQRTFQAAATNFEELAARLFPGGSGRLRLVRERDAPARVLGGGREGGAEPGCDSARDDEDGEGAADQLDRTAAAEEDLGVEIEITPAGKSMRRLSLLSGGEKSMTALAFLFAVFLARPCPFYILDEVEAALDDVNIARFLELLDAYAQRAQFIVVTHQRRTMEAADTLYGVSMGADGVSRVISQRMPPREREPRSDGRPAAA
jgi:chromosome segregation protein